MPLVRIRQPIVSRPATSPAISRAPLIVAEAADWLYAVGAGAAIILGGHAAPPKVVRPPTAVVQAEELPSYPGAVVVSTPRAAPAVLPKPSPPRAILAQVEEMSPYPGCVLVCAGSSVPPVQTFNFIDPRAATLIEGDDTGDNEIDPRAATLIIV